MIPFGDDFSAESLWITKNKPVSTSAAVIQSDGMVWYQDAATFRATIGAQAAGSYQLSRSVNIGNPNLGAGYIKFATITIPGGTFAAYNAKWSFDGRENIYTSCRCTFFLRREANNTFIARLYCSEYGSTFVNTISVRTNDGITWDFYVDATSGSWSAYYIVTPEYNSMPGVSNTFVASASMPTYSTVIEASRYGYAHRLVNARTLTIGNTGKSFDGTANVAWTLAEIGAQEALGYTPVNKAGDTMTGGLTLSAGNLNVGAGAIQTAGVTRISSGGAGTLTTLSTTGLATLAQATVSDLTTGRMVSTTTGGRLQALDAAGSRALLGVQTYLLVSSAKTAYALSTTPATIVSVPSTIGLANDETDFVCLEISGGMIAAKIATFTLDLGGTPMGSFTLPSCKGFDIKIRFSKALPAAETSIAFCGQTTGGALVQILSAATLWTTSKALTVTCAISTGTTTLYRTATAYKASQS